MPAPMPSAELTVHLPFLVTPGTKNRIRLLSNYTFTNQTRRKRRGHQKTRRHDVFQSETRCVLQSRGLGGAFRLSAMYFYHLQPFIWPHHTAYRARE